MAVTVYREYRLKVYLNARHFVIFQGNAGDIHPHTWEFSLTIRLGRTAFTQFGTFEKCVQEILSPYQNRLLNECAPFDVLIPTLEQLAETFSEEFYTRLEAIGGELTRVEVSETPTRSYILDLSGTHRARTEQLEKRMLADMADRVLEEIL